MQHAKQPVYIIAEAGVNHNQNRDMAFQLVDAAADCGVDAVKFQTFKAHKLAHRQVGKAHYQKSTTGASCKYVSKSVVPAQAGIHPQTDIDVQLEMDSRLRGNDNVFTRRTTTNETESQLEMLTRLELPYAWHHELQEHARNKGIEFLSTAFDDASLQFLQTLNLPIYKVPSGELTNAPLLWHFAKTGKPLIISTGMAMLSEVEQALAIVTHGLVSPEEPQSIHEVWSCWSNEQAREQLKGHVTLLHCTSQYPTPWHEVNLRAMDTLAAAFGLDVGYSDHTEGTMIPIAAVARGATVIEKHFTLDRTLPGPDHHASIEVNELKQMVANIRALELALGHGVKVPAASEWGTRQVARQSIIAVKHLHVGKTIERSDLTTARTGGGLSPSLVWELVGTASQKTYEPGEIVSL